MAEFQALVVVLKEPLSASGLMWFANEIVDACDREVRADRTARALAKTPSEKLRHSLPGSRLATAEIRQGYIVVNFCSADVPGSVQMIPDYKDVVPGLSRAHESGKRIVHLSMGVNDRASRILDDLAVELQDFGQCWRQRPDGSMDLMVKRTAPSKHSGEDSPSP